MISSLPLSVCEYVTDIHISKQSEIVLQNALDKNGRTALDLCENVNQPDWQSAASLLRFAMSQPVSALFSLVTD